MEQVRTSRSNLKGATELTSYDLLLLVDDPDASIIYDQVIHLINSNEYQEYAMDIVVMRLPPSDQRESPKELLSILE
jgi:hypothetical protein